MCVEACLDIHLQKMIALNQSIPGEFGPYIYTDQHSRQHPCLCTGLKDVECIRERPVVSQEVASDVV